MTSRSTVCRLSSAGGVLGVMLLVMSFVINPGPEPGASESSLLHYTQQHYAATLWGAWLQVVGPILIMAFALTLVYLSDAMHRLAGWLTLLGTGILMTVTLIEVTFYISALNASPATMSAVSLNMVSAVQHLYFIGAAPAVFLPLGLVLFDGRVLPKVFAMSALALGTVFAGLGVLFMLELRLPDFVTTFASVQALWWLAAAITLAARPSALGEAIT